MKTNKQTKPEKKNMKVFMVLDLGNLRRKMGRDILTLKCLSYFSLPFVHKGGPLGPNHF